MDCGASQLTITPIALLDPKSHLLLDGGLLGAGVLFCAARLMRYVSTAITVLTAVSSVPRIVATAGKTVDRKSLVGAPAHAEGEHPAVRPGWDRRPTIPTTATTAATTASRTHLPAFLRTLEPLLSSVASGDV
jgi:hypothetical protein